MKKILQIALLLLAVAGNAQIVNIPDPVFRAMLLIADTNNTIAIGSNGTTPIKVDINNDGQIQESEALAVYNLNLGGGIITNLTGISSFTNLRHLDIQSNQLTSLDVSALTNLKRLYCSGNSLISLDVSALPNLEFLFCESNQLSSLNIGSSPNFKFLSCTGNQLSSLDLNGLTGLLSVSCGYNQLTNLSLVNLPALGSLVCDHNQLSSLNLSGMPALTQLYCYYNLLTSLDLSAQANLTHLSCGENNIAVLNLNGLTQLSALECSYLPNNTVINGNNLNALTNFQYTGSNANLTLNGFQNTTNITLGLSQPTVVLNISGFGSQSTIHLYGSAVTNLTVSGSGAVNLEALNIPSNQLTSLTLTGLDNMKSLNCSNNQLVNLNLNNLSDLEQLNCANNNIQTLNLSGVPSLKHLDCNNNKLTGLNVSGLTALEYLDCSNNISTDLVGNQITSLNLAGLANLKYVDFSNYGFDGQIGAAGNLITSIDVSNLTHLQQLKCSKNNLPTLIVNGLTELTTLDCSHNQLTSLDLIGLTNLTHLNYSWNQLSNLNMTGLVNITELDCSHNSIATLNVVNMPNLTKLYCSTNSLTTLNLSGLTLLTDLRCDSNQITSLDLSNMPQLVSLNCSGNQLSTLDVSNVPELTSLSCSSNDLSSLDVSALTHLTLLYCGSNNLTSLDVSAQADLTDFSCNSNQLTSLDVGNSPDIIYFNCAQNQLSTLNVSNQPALVTLDCNDNQLTSLDMSQATILQGLYCHNNQLTTLDVSNSSHLEGLWCHNNSLTELMLKNGSFETSLNFSANPGLAYICADDAQLASIQTQLNTLGMNTTVSNSYCSFTPGGPHNTVIGTTIFDGNNNGCNINDPLHPNIRVDFTDGFTTGSAFTNTDGICTFYADAGNYTLFPNIENASAFNISPASASINFPDNNNNISNQSFCLSANGVHPDIEIVISPITPARPGFDAVYEVVYKNKGNTALSGTVTLGFDDSKLDLLTSVPAFDTQTSNNLEWSYNGLLPFESRTIRLEFNVNSPTETPAVNNGDILNFTTSITPVAGDETPSDNAFTFNQIVVNSFDPNDITCLEGNTVSPTEIGNYLHYIVNFENTGTASAVNVVVRTTVDEGQYNLHSLQVLNTSHNARTVIRGNIVEFIFENIELDASAGDPPVGGHGNVLFKIRSNDGLTDGDFVAKKAEIFFDYNFPIETNEAETVYQNLRNPDFETDNSILVYPNPTNGIVNMKSQSGVQSLELFDVQGRLLQKNMNLDSIDLSSRTNGLYFLRITTEKGSKVEKIIRN